MLTNGFASRGLTLIELFVVIALFADWPAENILWTTFFNDTKSTDDPAADLRWDRYTPYR
jgi:hypothetical protein